MATPSGEQAIGTLKVGDQVTAYDPATGKASTQTVQHVWINHDHDLLDVTLHADTPPSHDVNPDKARRAVVRAYGSQAPPADETIRTTDNHPWLTADRGWVLAGALRLGERVVRLDGTTAMVSALTVRPGVADYYNLTVSQLHTYAVGAGQFVVHNCGDSETFYRTMSKKHFDRLQLTGRVPATGETFISPSQEVAEGYEGVTVRFTVEGGTQDALAGVGVRDASDLASATYPDMPLVSSGWTENHAFFKGEGEEINIGLGQGKALDIFNNAIQSFEKVS